MTPITTVIQQPPRFRTIVKARGHTLDITPERREVTVMQVTTGFGFQTGGSGPSASAIRAIAADQDTVQIFDFESLVNATLGV